MSSLTAPWDRTSNSEKYTPKQVTLTEPEVAAAMSELCVKDFVEKFPRVDKFYADPVIQNQVYCLHSFVPTKGARPDEHGVYGFIKCRGTFATQREADERAEFLIRNVDSFHDVFTSYCGRPFPATVDKRYAQETNEVDIKNQIVKAVSEDVKAKVMKDKQVKDEMFEREQKLLQDSKKAEKGEQVETPMERYVTLHVKRANLVHVYLETQKNLEKVKKSLLKAREEIKEMDAANPEFQKDYMERYESARKEVGFDSVKMDGTYLQYMGLNDEELLGF